MTSILAVFFLSGMVSLLLTPMVGRLGTPSGRR